MASAHLPQVSFVLATHNRCEVVEHTLAKIARCELDRRDYEVIAVDNASCDGTPQRIASRVDRLVRLNHNAGSCAKAFAVEFLRGRYVIFLDDDSYPRPGSVTRMIERFEADRRLGAAGFTVHLPDGREEGGALPGVFVGCGVGLRTDALKAVGGLDHTFFMQAEEYDLSFRLVAEGWTVQVFDDLHVEHMKTPRARKTDRTTYHDVRNNLRIVARYLPAPFHMIYRADWFQRYRWLATRDGHQRSFSRGARAGRWRGRLERWTYRSRRLGPDALEYFFGWERIRLCMAALAGSGIRRILLADLGKNCFPYYRGARLAGITVTAVADDRFTAPARCYRGIPILPVEKALEPAPDAIVVSNSSAVHAAVTATRLASMTSQPVYNWFGGSERAETGCPILSEMGDVIRPEDSSAPRQGTRAAPTV